MCPQAEGRLQGEVDEDVHEHEHEHDAGPLRPIGSLVLYQAPGVGVGAPERAGCLRDWVSR